MDKLALSFGGLQSTSNVLNADRVSVDAGLPVIWTTELDHQALAQAIRGESAAREQKRHPSS